MADVNKLAPFILKWEGGFVNDPDDLGGATNKGITIATYRLYRSKKGYKTTTVDDLKNITGTEWTDILKTMYWDKWQADQINNQSIANILVDWVWASGAYGIELPQKFLNVVSDGIVGPKTLAAVNGYPDQRELFDKIVAERVDFVNRIVKSRPANAKFKKGWLNRINDFKYNL
jgi:lysozyme family protein